jgi:hypothetical protein
VRAFRRQPSVTRMSISDSDTILRRSCRPFARVGEKENAVRRANNHGLSPRDVTGAVSGYKSLIAEEKLFHDQTFGIASRLNAPNRSGLPNLGMSPCTALLRILRWSHLRVKRSKKRVNAIRGGTQLRPVVVSLGPAFWPRKNIRVARKCLDPGRPG